MSQELLSVAVIAVSVLCSGLALASHRKNRAVGHPVDTRTPQSLEQAVRQARVVAARLGGEETADWEAYATLSRDEEAMTLMQRAPGTAREDSGVRDLLWRRGITSEWLVRLVSPTRGSLLVGLSEDGEVTLFRDQRRSRLGSPRSGSAAVLRTQGLLDLLGPSWENVVVSHVDAGSDESGSWATWQLRDDAALGGTELHDSASGDTTSGMGVRVQLDVRATEGRVVELDRRLEVPQSHGVEPRTKLAGVQDAVGALAVLVSVFAVGVGVVVLTTTTRSPDVIAALSFACLVSAAAISADTLGFRAMVAGAWSAEVSLTQFRIVAVLTTVTIGLLYGILTLVAVAAGSSLTGLNWLWGELGRVPALAPLAGLFLAACWLAASSGLYAFLVRRDRCTVEPNPSARTQRATGNGVLACSLAALVSSISEESVYRFLVLVLVQGLAASVVGEFAAAAVAVVVSAVLWSCAHSAPVTDPPQWRFVELIAVGLVLALAFLMGGLLTVIVAHAAYNLVVSLSHDQAPSSDLNGPGASSRNLTQAAS